MEEERSDLTESRKKITSGGYRFVMIWAACLLILYAVGATFIELWLASLNPQALAVVKGSPLGQTLGNERMFLNLREAVQAYEKGENHDNHT